MSAHTGRVRLTSSFLKDSDTLLGGNSIVRRRNGDYRRKFDIVEGPVSPRMLPRLPSCAVTVRSEHRSPVLAKLLDNPGFLPRASLGAKRYSVYPVVVNGYASESINDGSKLGYGYIRGSSSRAMIP